MALTDKAGTKVPAKTREVFDYLVQCADDMRTVEYRELADATKLHPQGLWMQLQWIQDEICIKRGLPWISIIVVYGDWKQGPLKRRPAPWYQPAAGKVDPVADPLNYEQRWREKVMSVYAYDWKTVPFEAAS